MNALIFYNGLAQLKLITWLRRNFLIFALFFLVTSFQLELHGAAHNSEFLRRAMLIFERWMVKDEFIPCQRICSFSSLTPLALLRNSQIFKKFSQIFYEQNIRKFIKTKLTGRDWIMLGWDLLSVQPCSNVNSPPRFFLPFGLPLHSAQGLALLHAVLLQEPRWNDELGNSRQQLTGYLCKLHCMVDVVAEQLSIKRTFYKNLSRNAKQIVVGYAKTSKQKNYLNWTI